jgi:hypothetical protein
MDKETTLAILQAVERRFDEQTQFLAEVSRRLPPAGRSRARKN